MEYIRRPIRAQYRSLGTLYNNMSLCLGFGNNDNDEEETPTTSVANLIRLHFISN